MKLWTYLEARTKLQTDEDLKDELFVTPAELIGYFNEAIEEAQAEILKIDEDYLLTSYPVPLVTGTSAYPYPYNIFAFKMRGIVYANGTIIYDVKPFRRKGRFENIAYANQYATSDDYRWYHTNPASGALFNIIPAARETATVPPMASPFTPLTMWFIREANRIPVIGEYVPHWDDVAQASAIAANVITVAGTYVTGDQVKLSTSGTIPGGLVVNTVYYVISVTSTTIKLATTLANALAGTNITISSNGTGILSISIAAQQAIIDATLIDIPEAMTFLIQWAKCRCKDKDTDPRLGTGAGILEQQRAKMVSTLTERAQDDANEVEPDLSSYREMS